MSQNHPSSFWSYKPLILHKKDSLESIGNSVRLCTIKTNCFQRFSHLMPILVIRRFGFYPEASRVSGGCGCDIAIIWTGQCFPLVIRRILNFNPETKISGFIPNGKCRQVFCANWYVQSSFIFDLIGHIIVMVLGHKRSELHALEKASGKHKVFISMDSRWLAGTVLERKV